MRGKKFSRDIYCFSLSIFSSFKIFCCLSFSTQIILFKVFNLLIIPLFWITFVQGLQSFDYSFILDYRSGLVQKRGKQTQRSAPYRPHYRDYPKDRSFGPTAQDGTYYPPGNGQRRDQQPPPPGESKPPPRFGPPDVTKIRCYSCFKMGHKSPNCPDKNS